MSLKDLSSKYEKLVNEFKETATKQLNEDLKTLFDKYPLVESVGFNCYANYWNDGDSCPFEARNDWGELYINENSGYDNEEKEIGRSVYKEFSELFKCIPNEIYEGMFGNDTQITFYRNGKVQIEDFCDHN